MTTLCAIFCLPLTTFGGVCAYLVSKHIISWSGHFTRQCFTELEKKDGHFLHIMNEYYIEMYDGIRVT